MRYKIEEDDRMSTMLSSDRFTNPENITPILKSEIQQIARDYLLLSGDLKVRYRQTENGLLFMVEIPTSGVKNVGRLV